MFTDMDIKKEIERLKEAKAENEIIKSTAHERIKAINKKIGKLETVLRDAGEILFEDENRATEPEAK